MNDYWNDPPETPEPPECCGEIMEVAKDGRCVCMSCLKIIPVPKDISPDDETQNHGGPAFPPTINVPPGTSSVTHHAGMSLRDYFAAAALQGLIAKMGSTWTLYDYAKAAYRHADAMLKAREASRE